MHGQMQYPSNMHGKLSTLTERFSNFERQLQADLKAKEEREDSNCESITASIARLDHTVDSEINRRKDAHKSLQATFEAQVAVVQDRLEAAFLDRFDVVQSEVDALSERMQTVEKDFTQSRERYIQEMADKSGGVDKDVANLKVAFEHEVVERGSSERVINKQTEDLLTTTTEKFEQESIIRDNKHRRLREDFEESKRMREDAHTQFRACVKADVDAVNTGISEESRTRSQADDDIVNALNHYTKALQDAVRSVSQQALRAANGPATASSPTTMGA